MAKGRTKTQAGDIRITNLNAALRALRGIAPDAHKELKQANRVIVARVVTAAQGQAQGAPHSRQAAKAASSLRAYGSDTPTVVLGSAGIAFAMGAEFGGGRSVRTRQFPPWRGNGKAAGYFLFPTVRNLHDWITSEYLDALDDALSKAARRGSA